MKPRFPWLWVGVAATGFAGANLKVAMFGTGEIDWAHFRFEWTLFIVGILSVVFSVCKAYYDQGQHKPSETPQVEVVNTAKNPVPVETK